MKIKGRMFDRKTGEPLIGGEVLATWPGPDGTCYRSTRCNLNGEFLFLLPESAHRGSTVQIKGTYIGYVSLELTQSVDQEGECKLPLQAECDIPIGET